MDARDRAIFYALILTQAIHSLEEIVFPLYEVFRPARFISSLISDNLAVGFFVLNTAVVAFGVWCCIARIYQRHPFARGWAWFWSFVELGNGVNHIGVALFRGTYFPGLVTAVPLVVLSVLLGIRLYGNRYGKPCTE